jgi:hypothetical protein
MQRSNFRIVPLPTAVAEAARAHVREGASDHVCVAVDASASYPCRHCLRWAQLGEQVVLFPYASIPAGRPYAESGPIFVHVEPCPRYAATDKYPGDFRNGRVIRAYNSQQHMIAAEAASNGHPETVIAKLLANPETEFLQARSADRGCYTFAIQRA